MSKLFSFERKPGLVTVVDRPVCPDYQLYVHTGVAPDSPKWQQVYFMVRLRGCLHGQLTGRDLDECAFPHPIPLNPDYQYLEIGPGFSETVSHVTQRLRQEHPGSDLRPYIVIDPADYGRMKDMMEYLLDIEELSLPPEVLCMLQKFRQRAELILDPARVLHLRRKVEDVVSDPSLRGIADVVIDWQAATRYAESGTSYAMRFLKPGGVLLTDRVMRDA